MNRITLKILNKLRHLIQYQLNMTNKKIIYPAIIVASFLTITVIVVVLNVLFTADKDSPNTVTANKNTTTSKENIYQQNDDEVDTNEAVGTTTNTPSNPTPSYANSPGIESYPIFGTNIVFYTHQSIYTAAKVNIKPVTENGRTYLLLTGKGCKTLTYRFYNNSDGFYDIPERRTVKNIEYVYTEGPVLNSPKSCKPEQIDIDNKLKEESLFIFRSLS